MWIITLLLLLFFFFFFFFFFGGGGGGWGGRGEGGLHINEEWGAGFPNVRMLPMKDMPVYNIYGITQIYLFIFFFWLFFFIKCYLFRGYVFNSNFS